jgi:hypothetical protein
MQELKKLGSRTEWEQSRRFSYQEGVLLHKGCVCIPKGKLRQSLLHEVHDSLTDGHVGGDRMHLPLVDIDVYWSQMRGTCLQYVKGCGSCLRVKAPNQLPVGLLQPLPTAELGRWEPIVIDFITDLPLSGLEDPPFDAITTVVDHLTKCAHFWLFQKSMGAEKTATLFVYHYFRQHGVPHTIISDRDPRFVSDFWKVFMQAIGSTLRMALLPTKRPMAWPRKSTMWWGHICDVLQPTTTAIGTPYLHWPSTPTIQHRRNL